MTPSNILTEFEKLENEINYSFDCEEWLNFKVISSETEKAFSKFLELLRLDIDNINE